MHNFKAFAAAIAAQWAVMSTRELYQVTLSGQDVWDQYLDAFPAGTNEIYRVRREYDGSYDRNVIRRIGNVVAIIDGVVTSIWDVKDVEYPFNEVCAILASRVRFASPIGLFRVREKKLGYEKGTNEQLPGGAVKHWDHFHAPIFPKHYSEMPGAAIGAYNTNMGVYIRGLKELTLDALDTTIDLITAGSLYRGDEFKDKLIAFRTLKLRCELYAPSDKLNFLFDTLSNQPLSHTLVRNSVIGQLLQDLSEGVDVETAVKSYERMVAPTNYKRPTALITPAMITTAQSLLDKLGLESALHRRFATVSDVSVNNVLWVNNDVKAKMKDGIAGMIGTLPVAKPDDLKAKDITIDKFMKDVLPSTSSMDVLVRNQHLGNLVSITAPIESDAGRIFKWDNPFAWSYAGNITDSITQRVKSAGGNVDAKLRVSLAWFNQDDLDLHSLTPRGHIFYAEKMGVLDVDMNAGYNTVKDPVENQSWVSPTDGKYVIRVHQFNKRVSGDGGFTIELFANGELQQFSYTKSIPDKAYIEVMDFSIKKGELTNLQVNKELVGGNIKQTKWGIDTETFIKCNMLMNSPNFWDDNTIGNKHWFFLLDGCVNDEPTRGFYNEFLRGDLEQHRKVFEVLGDKTKCQSTNEQLSGVGFSSTKRDTVTVRANNKLYNIQF